MPVFAIVVLAFTVAMIAAHLATTALLRRMLIPGPRWLSLANLVRFEGAYYVVLSVFALGYRDRRLLAPLLVLGILHLAAWAFAEMRPGWVQLARVPKPRMQRILPAVQIFDGSEALVLFWIAWTLFHF